MGSAHPREFMKAAFVRSKKKMGQYSYHMTTQISTGKRE
jgi:hypothetical protein